MAKKCQKCGAPIEGFFAKISALAGVKQSTKNPDYCNKCVNTVPQEKQAPAAEETFVAEPAPEQPNEVVRTDLPADAVPEADKKTSKPTNPEDELVLNEKDPDDLFEAEEKK